MNLPNDFINNMKRLLGTSADDFLSSYDNQPLSGLRVNIRKVTNPADMLYKLCVSDTVPDETTLHEYRTDWENNGYYYSDETASSDTLSAFGKKPLYMKSPGKHPYHHAGLYYIQEPSAMLPVTKLLEDCDELPPDYALRILDLCAAPGGKSTQIADHMKGRGLLISNEIIKSRADILSENLERMGVDNVLALNEDPLHLKDVFYDYFDRILVDAPCSGEGMFRKHPEVLDEWSLSQVDICAKRQDMILDCAAEMLRAGGRIVFSTCTFNDSEDDGSVDRFLSRHPEFICMSREHIYPHTHPGEGHYCAVLMKEGDAFGVKSYKPYGRITPAGAKDKDKFDDFVKKTLTESGLSKMREYQRRGAYPAMFGTQMYLVSDLFPSLRSLKVVRFGLHLGEIKKDRFEPSHAFALVLGKDDVRNVCNLDASGSDVCKYLAGESLMLPENMSGWTLVCTDGYSLGWGKSAGNILKNHYPKGLRVN